MRRAWALFSRLADGWIVGDGTYAAAVQDAMIFSGAAAWSAVVEHPNDIVAHAVWLEGARQ